TTANINISGRYGYCSNIILDCLFYGPYWSGSLWGYKCLYSKGFRPFFRICGNGNGLGNLILARTVELHQHFTCFARSNRTVFWIIGYGTTTTAGGIGNDQGGVAGIGKRKNCLLGGILFYGTKIVLNFIEFYNRKAFGRRIPFCGNFYIGGIDLAGSVLLTGEHHKSGS